MAATEVKGSRQEWDDGKFVYGVMLYVGTALTDVPAHGTTFTRFAGLAEDRAAIGRKLYLSRIDPDVIPGILFIECHFKDFKKYTAT